MWKRITLATPVLRTTNLSPNGFTVTVDRVADANGYKVKAEGVDNDYVSLGPNMSRVFSSLDSDTPYTVLAMAVNTAHNVASAVSSVSVRTERPLVTRILPVGDSHKRYKLSDSFHRVQMKIEPENARYELEWNSSDKNVVKVLKAGDYSAMVQTVSVGTAFVCRSAQPSFTAETK